MKKSILLIILMIAATLSGKCGTVKGKGVFQIDVDVATFSGNETQNYIEIYYGVRESILSYKVDSSRFVGAANLKIEVRNDTAVVAKKEWTVPHIIEDTSRLGKGQTMMGLETFGLPVGRYTLSAAAYDVYNPERRDTLVLPLVVKPYSSGKETLSDIELCTSIESSSNKQSMFYKNTLEVIPNASRLYGVGVPILYYYLEAYNLRSTDNKHPLVIRSAVVDALGKEVITHDKSKPRTLNSSVEVGTVNVTSLRGGTYFLRLSLLDSGNITLTSSFKKFFVYKPQAIAEAPGTLLAGDFTSSEYAVMSDSELNEEFSHVRYISNDIERNQYDQLSGTDAKRKFLYEFWRRRAPDPLVTENSVKEDYKKRVTEANRDFTRAGREGWKTEQGRIHILYGSPDETERFPSSSQSNPYEIWHYNNIQGGVIFVFVDRTDLGDYVLVHSTHRDEIHDENWFEEYTQKIH